MTQSVEIKTNGLEPISLECDSVIFFDGRRGTVRSSLIINSLELGTLGYDQYRFVARRTKQSSALVRRHIFKLCRNMWLAGDKDETECYIVPVFARVLRGGELLRILTEALATYSDVSPSRICVELSADILYEDLESFAAEIERIRSFGVAVAIGELGDEFCPVFRLTSIPFDLALMHEYVTENMHTESGARIAASLLEHLHAMGVRVLAPRLTSERERELAREIGFDGCIGERINNDEREDDDADV